MGGCTQRCDRPTYPNMTSLLSLPILLTLLTLLVLPTILTLLTLQTLPTLLTQRSLLSLLTQPTLLSLLSLDPQIPNLLHSILTLTLGSPDTQPRLLFDPLPTVLSVSAPAHAQVTPGINAFLFPTGNPICCCIVYCCIDGVLNYMW
jgi:hypothetical protein